MYSTSTSPVSSIVSDSQILLPRYQRKKAWKDKKRFELCISLFKDYPLGTIVIKKEIQPGNKVRKWLLDGRQRRDTFVEMQNPENIYRWAKQYLNLKNKDTADDIRKKFEEKVSEWIQIDTLDGPSNFFDSEKSGSFSHSEDLKDENVFSNEGLYALLDIVCAVHPITGKVSNFGKPFISENKLIYMRRDEKGKEYVDVDRLIQTIRQNIQEIPDDIDALDADTIAGWLTTDPEVNLKSEINRNLTEIRRSVRAVKLISNFMSNAKVQLVELDGSCRSSDARKIFEIINTSGVPLTGPEILSAKPDWNIKVDNPRDILIKNVQKMYNALGIHSTDIVRWDVAATFTERIAPEAKFILGNLSEISYEADDSQFDKKLSSGFKLLSGRYLNSITKDSMDSLSRLNDADIWNYPTFEDEIATVSKILLKDNPIRLLASYNVCMIDYLSYTVALNYILLLIKRWNELGSPESPGKAMRIFITDSRVLLDRMIYEYATGLWKGSSDSRLSRNLGDDYNLQFTPVSEDDWKELIEEAFEKNKIHGQSINTDVLKALTYYFSMLREKTILLGNNESVEVDHIIAAALFTSNNEFKDSLYNYALLPPYLNKSKSDKSFDKLSPKEREQICKFEDLDESKLDNLSPNEIEHLKEIRKDIVNEIIDRRKDFVKDHKVFEL